MDLSKLTIDEALAALGAARNNLNLTWQDIADKLNAQFSCGITAEACRKRFARSGASNVAQQSERVLLRDERADYQRTIREQARSGYLIEQMREVLRDTVVPFEPVAYKGADADSDINVVVSDIHCGALINNAFNKYDETEMCNRLIRFAASIPSGRRCNVMLLGDRVMGAPPLSCRLESNLNIIEQTKRVAGALAAFVRGLATRFEFVYVYGVSGNHARLFPNKEDARPGEDMDALAKYIMSLHLANQPNVKFPESDIDPTIAMCIDSFGHVMLLVHGDHDDPRNLSRLVGTNYRPEAVVMGHRHDAGVSNVGKVKVVQNGSVMGPDSYAVGCRFVNPPEQVWFTSTKDSAVDAVHFISLI